MAVFKCKMCGGTLEIEENTSVAICEYCGTKQTLPRLEDEKRANLYDRANHFRRNNEFDKAVGIYEQILNEDTADSEAYWSLVLCRYGIEYVEDPTTHKRVPTVNRAQYTSILADEDYKSALQYADNYQKEVYETEALAIDKIQKGILEISQKEEPFDVFICYKETNNSGRRTQDSVLANDLYHQLTQEGFKVFFARITLEDKLGAAYEPYIFAALNSAKVMVVLGTKPEYFTAVWVRNEWSRYLGLIKSGAKKVLIPAYRDMDSYDLPEEFSHLQAQDMSKLGFMQDLIRGIKKLTATDEPKIIEKQVVITNAGEGSAGSASLLKRAFLFLEDGNWNSADEYCEKVLDIDPECAKAYMGKMLSDLKIRKEEELSSLEDEEVITKHPNYQKACRFADKTYRGVLEGYVECILQRKEQKKREAELKEKEQIYEEATLILKKIESRLPLEKQQKLYLEAAARFEVISGYMDSDEKAKMCLQSAEDRKKENLYEQALWHENEAAMKTEEIQINHLKTAVEIYEKILDYKAAGEKKEQCLKKIEHLEKIWKNKLEKQRQKKKKIVGVTIVLVSVAIVVLVLYQRFLAPMLQYNSAMELEKNGKKLEAYRIFDELNDYKDCEAQAEKVYGEVRLEADTLLENGNFIEAAEKFNDLAEYSSGSQKEEMVSWSRYASAKQLAEDKNYEDAALIFYELGSFMDSMSCAQDATNKLYYEKAALSLENKEYLTAIELYEKIGADSKVLQAKKLLAQEYETQGNWEEAVALYDELNMGYNAWKLVRKEAEKCIANNQYTEAMDALSKIAPSYWSEFSAEYKIYYEMYDKCTAWKVSQAEEGDEVAFGRYQQGTNADIEAPIYWIVAEKKGNKTLLISKFALIFTAYHNDLGYYSWTESDLRKELNERFITNAFFYHDCFVETTNGDAIDKVFILSASEMKDKLSQYGEVALVTNPTVWVKSCMENEEDWKYEGNFKLWTRELKLYEEENNVHYVGDYGYITGVGLHSQDGWALVRPAVWIEFK